MDIIWYGQAMFKLKGRSATVIIDPFDPNSTGLKFPKEVSCNLCLQTHAHSDHSNTSAVTGNPLVIKGPGEYESSGVSVRGIQTFHDSSNGSERGTNTVYHLLIDGINLVHLGDLGHILTEEQISQINSADILMVPVGSVYTIDAEAATTIVSQLEPKVVIPMHYNIPTLGYDLEGVEGFLKHMGAEGVSPLLKLSITKDKLPDETQVVVLTKSS